MKVEKEHENLIKDVFYLLSVAQDLDEKEKYHHGLRVALMSEKIAAEVLPEEKDNLFFAGLLHDIAGLGSKNHIIHHPDLIVQMQDKSIFNHPYRGADFLRTFPAMFHGQHRIADYILQHHEWYKGAGYPRQLKGNDILLGARILRVADAFDIYSRRVKEKEEISFKAPFPILETNGEVDPSLVKVLKGIIKDENFVRSYTFLSGTVSDYLANKEIEFFASNIEIDEVFQYIGCLIDLKLDSSSPGHSKGDVQYTVQIAQALQLSIDEINLIKRAAYLHDIGKLAIPVSILSKPAWLTEQEWAIVRKHAEVTTELLDGIPSLAKYSFSGSHHERWDGKGYPKGMKAEEIHLGARIISVADALDAMTSQRPYRPVLTFKEALGELEKNAGSQFDPKIVQETINMYK